MAVPKRKRSKAKKRSNKANWKLKKYETKQCKYCNNLVVFHHACLCEIKKSKKKVEHG
tara:strand:+ start:2239 stop:2412 length:174 start_codon:yes stop_codon:yes gene_type:complete